MTFIACFSDVLDQLSSFVKNRPVAQSADQGVYRSVAETALREIVGARDWTCLKKIWRIAMQATVGGGTVSGTPVPGVGEVTYSKAGGTYPYQVTLTGGTWPNWEITNADMEIHTTDAEIRIGTGSVVCEIDQIISPTIMTLKPTRVPDQDVTTPSPFSMGLSWYRLPPDFSALNMAAEKNAWFLGEFIEWAEMATLTKYRTMTGIVKRFSIGPCPKDYNRKAIYVYPWSMGNDEYDLMIKVRPRNIRISGHEPWNYQGTVTSTTTNGVTTVTGTGVAFRSTMAGAMIRFGSNSTTRVTGTVGSIGTFNPFQYQEQIYSISSDLTTLTLNRALPADVTNVTYNVSDPVTLDGVVYDAYLKCCEKHMAYRLAMKDAKDIERMYQETLFEAKKQDRPVHKREAAGMGDSYVTRLRDMKSRPWVGG